MTIRRLVDRRPGFFLVTNTEVLARCSLCPWLFHSKFYDDASDALTVHLQMHHSHHRRRRPKPGFSRPRNPAFVDNQQLASLLTR